MINKFGLYENIVPRYRISGLKSDISLDNQTQGWWLPFFKDGEIYLVDTYHIDYSISIMQSKNFIEDFIEGNENDKDNSYLIGKANWDYYYGGSVKITPITEKCFREVCDLRYFEFTKDDPNDYEAEDIVKHVQLWREHGYPNGVTLKRKDASKSINKQALNKMYKTLDDISTSWIHERDMNELESYLQNPKVNEKIKLKLKAAVKLFNTVIECNELINKARAEYRDAVSKINEE